ncbi:MAG TPA: hypothetical protein VE961_12620 [Pyrinomonadaceae bacterium]|nr:hypothetical protein [Pyrinomonadaceae bacterium]
MAIENQAGFDYNTETMNDIQFISWQEPAERSFTVDVPQGWQIVGGVNWVGPTNAQPFVRVRSPDEIVQVFVGDPDILPRQVPNAFSWLQTNAGEGQVFRTPSGDPAVVQRFLTGAQYAKQHAMWRLCRQPQWVREADLPELTQTMTASIQPEARAWGVQATASAGEVSFLCGTQQGQVIAVTVIGSSPMTQIWSVLRVSAFLSADPMKSMTARYVMEHMAGSFKLDPHWNANYEQRVRQITGSVISMQNASLQASLAASRQAQQTLSRLNHPNEGVHVRPGDVKIASPARGSDYYVSDALGRSGSVSGTADSYFMDHSGNISAGRAGGLPPDNTGVWSPVFRVD